MSISSSSNVNNKQACIDNWFVERTGTEIRRETMIIYDDLWCGWFDPVKK